MEHWEQTYHSLVIRGKLRTEVRWITERETGRVLQPGDRCKKTGERVMEVLRAKHPEARTPTAVSLDLYPDRPPELTPVDITNDTVTAVRTRRNRIGVPPTLAPAVRFSQRGTLADCRGLCGVAWKWAATMGRL